MTDPNKKTLYDLSPDTPTSTPFDYGSLDESTADTLHWAESQIQKARQKYVVDMAKAVSMAHEQLCGTVVHNVDELNKQHNQYSEETFRRWCESIGIKKTTAYKLLQVDELLSGSTPEELAVLESAPPSLLYAAAKPSAPSEAVEAVKAGDITTHKEYQELLAKLETEQEARQAAERIERQIKQQAAETERQLEGARQLASAANLRADKWREKAEALSAQPVEAKVVDVNEVDRLAAEKAKAMLAEMQPDTDAPDDANNAYDAAILAARQLDAIWQALQPWLPRLAAEQRTSALKGLNEKMNIIQKGLEQWQ